MEPVKGFKAALIAGTLFQTGLVYWLTVSMGTYGGVPLGLCIILLIGFATFLAFFIAVPVYMSCCIVKKRGWGISLTLPFLWTASEYVKSWVLTGFPWENLGYSQFENLQLIQISDITGVYGITFLIVFTNCVIFSLINSAVSKQKLPYRQIFLAVVLLSATMTYGHYRVNDFKSPQGNQLKIAIVQPNIAQDIKWDPMFLDETMRIFSRLSIQSADFKPDMVVWPESATPFFFQSEQSYKKTVGNIVNKTGAYLLFGSPSWQKDIAGNHQFFNSAFLLSPSNEIVGRYDKTHLVPYGEYVPLKQLFTFIDKMVSGIGDFSPGNKIANLSLPSCSFATLICYEIIFPDLTRRFVKNGAEFIVNITNDAWFGDTSAPYQNLSMAVLRAVENKRYLVRSANTGISAFINPAGTIYARTQLFNPDVLTATITCMDCQTFYSQHGDLFAICCFVLCLLMLLTLKNRSVSTPGSGKD